MNQKVTLWKGIFFFVGTNDFFGSHHHCQAIHQCQDLSIIHKKSIPLHRLRKQENHLIVAKLFTKTNFLRKSFFST
jgi:hypothetical protein